jgi:hypothetical protein
MIESSLDRFQVMKRNRMTFMVYELWRRNGVAKLNEFKGSIAVHYGIRRKTQDEYIEDLKNAGIVSVKDNIISLLWSSDKTEEWLEEQRFVAFDKRTEKKRRI